MAISVPTPAAIDPYDLMEAVNVLTQMPKDFYEKIVTGEGHCNELLIIHRSIPNGKSVKKHLKRYFH